MITLFDLVHYAHPEWFPKWKAPFYRTVVQRAASVSSHIITASAFSAGEIAKRIKSGNGKISIIPCGVDQTLFSHEIEEKKKEECRKRYSLPKRFFLHITNGKKHKNLDRLLLAFSKVRKEDDVLVILGPKIEAHSVLSFQGVAREDLPVFFSLAEAFFFPSLYEGFGLPPLEAMSCGCPVIAGNRGAVPEVCGDAALYVNPEEVNDIAVAINHLKGNQTLRKTMAKAGIERAKTFCWKEAANKHREIIERLINE